MSDMLDVTRKDYGSIEHRKEIASNYALDEPWVLGLPKKEFGTLILGIIRGHVEGMAVGAEQVAHHFDTDYKCIPIGLWNHREKDFKKILEEEMEELKNAEINKERNDDSAESSTDRQSEEKVEDKKDLQR